MGRKCVKVKTLHKYSIEKLNEIERKIQRKYGKDVIRAVIMRSQGVHTSVIARCLVN